MGNLANQFIYEENTQIITRFRAGETSPKILWQPKLSKYGVFTLSSHYSGFLQSLRLKVDINSLKEVPIPAIPLEESRVNRAAALRDMEWKNPRYQVDILMASGGDYHNLFSISLQTRLPYYTVSLLSHFTENADFLLGPETILAAQVVNAGYGYPQGDDEIIFYGAVLEQAYYYAANLDQFSNQCEDYIVSVDGTGELIRGANVRRSTLSIINDSPYRVWLSLGKEASIGRGILLTPDGSSYTIDRSSYYTGPVYAVSEGNSNIVGVECSS